MFKKPKHWLYTTLIATFIFLLPTLFNDWVNWDDPIYVIDNYLIRDFSFEGIKKMFTTNHVLGAYVPIVLVSWSLDYAFSGLSPMTFHITNLLFHLLNVGLVFYLTKQISTRVEVAFITALLFGIHPMHVETVAWITARKDLLYSLFLIGGLIAYTKYIKGRASEAKKYYVICFVLFVLSLLSKGTAVVFPLILFVFDFLKKRNNLRKMFLEKLPFFALSFWFTSMAIRAQDMSGALESRIHPSVLEALATGFYGYFSYLVKVIWPFNLSVYQPYPMAIGESYPWYYYASAIPVLMIFGLMMLKLKQWKKFGFGMAFFFLSLIPVIQVLPFGASVTADRFAYLPYFGLFYILGVGFIKLLDKLKQFRKHIIIVGVIYLFVLGGVTFSYATTWKDSETLWTNVIKHYPKNYNAYLNRSAHRIDLKQYDGAFQDCEKGIVLNPKNSTLFHNRAIVQNKYGRKKEAIIDYTRAIKLDKNYASAYLNRGLVHEGLGESQKALLDINKFLKIKPREQLGFYNRGLLFKKMGKYANAVSDFSKAIMLDPNFYQSYMNRAIAFTELGKKELAISDFNSVIKLKPYFATAYTKKGDLFLDLNSFDYALESYNKAILLDRNQVDVFINRGFIRLNMKHYELALEDFNQALVNAPQNHLVYFNRSLVYQMMKDYNKSLKDLDECIQLNPRFNPAYKEKKKVIALINTNN